MQGKIRFCYGLAIMALVVTPAAYAQSTLDEQLRQPVNREVVNQKRDVADQLLRLGERQLDQGDYRSALTAWSRAVDLYYDIGDMAAMERAYGNIGLTYAQLGDYDNAEVAVRRQLAIAQDTQNVTSQIFVWNTLGTLMLQRGALEPAAQAYEEGLNIAYRLKNEEGLGLSLSNLGLLSTAQGNYDAAISYYKEANEYRFRTGNLAGRANTNNNLGDAYLAQGQLDEAIGAYRLGLGYGQDSNNVRAQIQAIDGFINIYMARNEWPQVRRYLDERIALTLDADNELDRLITFKQLGEFYQATGDIALAQAEYERAYQLARLLDQTNLEAELFNRLLSLQSSQDNRD